MTRPKVKAVAILADHDGGETESNHYEGTVPMNTTTTVPDPTDYAAEYDKAHAIAKATPCGVSECDGESHDPIAPPSEWTHSLPDLEFAGSALVGMWTIDSKSYMSDIDMHAQGEQMTAAELREEADKWAAYPAFLRAAADKLDALNAEAE